MNKNDLFRTFADVNDDILERDETAEKKTCRLKWGGYCGFHMLDDRRDSLSPRVSGRDKKDWELG